MDARTAISPCALAAWTTASGSIMMFPGMAAYRGPARRMILGSCPSGPKGSGSSTHRRMDRGVQVWLPDWSCGPVRVLVAASAKAG